MKSHAVNHIILQKFRNGELSLEEFRSLPLVVEGESKEIRYLGFSEELNKELAIHYFKPTIYSFSQNRCGIVPTSNIPRVQMTKKMVQLLQMNGIDHAYLEATNEFVLAELLIETTTGYKPDVFRLENSPCDLKWVPPIEIVIKRFHTGTTKHEMYGMDYSQTRPDHPFYANFPIRADQPYPIPMVRFDWRNPLTDKSGNRLADKALSQEMADFFIDTKQASINAKRAFHIISDFLAYCDILCYDVCMFFTTDGNKMYGEVSPDCGRYRHYNYGSLDKDIWRAGGSSDDVLKKWNLIVDIINEKFDEYIIQNQKKKMEINYNYNNTLPIYIGTSNPYKVSEFLSEMSYMKDRIFVAPEDESIIENGSTFLENAEIKAKSYARLVSDGIIIAEDSGLVIPTLQNNPGIYSARFSSCILDHRSLKIINFDSSVLKNLSRDQIDKKNIEYVLRLLKDRIIDESEKINAYFVCAMVVVNKNGQKLFECEGKSFGYISLSPKGSNGFGYDSIFIGEDTDGLTYAEIDPYRKMLRSHRIRAVKQVKRWIDENYS